MLQLFRLRLENITQYGDTPRGKFLKRHLPLIVATPDGGYIVHLSNPLPPVLISFQLP